MTSDDALFNTCSGEGHAFCWGPVVEQVHRSDRTPTSWEQVLRGATVYQRGTPSCIWNVAGHRGPGSAERLRLGRRVDELSIELNHVYDRLQGEGYKDGILYAACLAVIETAVSYSSEERWGVYPIGLFERCAALRDELEAWKS